MKKKKNKFFSKNIKNCEIASNLNEQTLFYFEKLLLEIRIRKSLFAPFSKKEKKSIKNEIALLNSYLFFKKG